MGGACAHPRPISLRAVTLTHYVSADFLTRFAPPFSLSAAPVAPPSLKDAPIVKAFAAAPAAPAKPRCMYVLPFRVLIVPVCCRFPCADFSGRNACVFVHCMGLWRIAAWRVLRVFVSLLTRGWVMVGCCMLQVLGEVLPEEQGPSGPVPAPRRPCGSLRHQR
jgi:hypothetical protein